MYRLLAKTFYIAQVAFSVLVIIFGAVFAVRCLLDSHIFPAICFAVIAWICGYLLLFRASLRELRHFNSKQSQL